MMPIGNIVFAFIEKCLLINFNKAVTEMVKCKNAGHTGDHTIEELRQKHRDFYRLIKDHDDMYSLPIAIYISSSVGLMCLTFYIATKATTVLEITSPIFQIIISIVCTIRDLWNGIMLHSQVFTSSFLLLIKCPLFFIEL